VELHLQPLAGHAFDQPAGAQQPDPEPQPRLAVALFWVRDGGERRGHHVSPPDSEMAWPVMLAAPSVHSHSTVSAISCGVMKRPCGFLAVSSARASASLRLV